VAVPADPGVVRIDATLGVVIGRDATRVSEAQARDYVAGYVIASDVTLPHDNYYRPPLRTRCRDGFCPMTACLSPGAEFDADRAVIDIFVNGKAVHRRSLEGLLRPIGKLIADVTEYMTLPAGSVLLVGAPEGAPLAHPGDEVRIDIAGLGSLSHRLVAESSNGEAA
jgi:5-oxopent-3-ene-1,2,5-tricarboxylate decarboxylase/2-hydroxyhepta-2,4-diene-1,7-dioate isomerase